MLNQIRSFILSPRLSLILFGLMTTLPFLVFRHRLPMSGFHGEWLAAVLGTAALLPLLDRKAWQPMQLPHVALIFPGLMALLFMQWMLGMLHSAHVGLMAASYMMWAFLLTILGRHLREQLGWESIVGTLAWFLVAGGMLNVAFVVLQLLLQNGVDLSFMPKLKGYGAMAQANHFASYMTLSLVSLIFLFATRRIPLAWFVPGGLLLLAMLALSGSRSTWLYLTALAVLMLLLRTVVVAQVSSRANAELQQSRRLFRLALVLLPAYALVQLAIYLLFDAFALQKMGALPTERLMHSTVAVSGLAVRLHLWQESLQLFMQSPWLGIGLGQMRWQTFLLLDPAAPASMPQAFEHAHNLFIHLLAEMGVGAALLVAAALWTWLRAFSWRSLSVETWWLLGMLAILGIHSMLEYPLWYAYFLGPVALLLGAGESKCAQIRVAFSGRALVVTAMVLAAVHLGSTYVANKKLETWLYTALQTGVSDAQVDALHEDMRWVQEKSLLAPYATLVYASLLTPDETSLDAKLAVTRASLNFMPTRKAAYAYALLLALDGDRPGAVAQLNRALAAFPGNFTRQVRSLPFQYWQFYIELLNEAIPGLNLGGSEEKPVADG